MVRFRQAALELVRAVCVLALLFLNFAHVGGASAAPVPGYASLPVSYCGDVAPHPDIGDATCHACRIGGSADLPRPTSLPLRAARPLAGAAPVDGVALKAPPQRRTGNPRAPPALA